MISFAYDGVLVDPGEGSQQLIALGSHHPDNEII